MDSLKVRQPEEREQVFRAPLNIINAEVFYRLSLFFQDKRPMIDQTYGALRYILPEVDIRVYIVHFQEEVTLVHVIDSPFDLIRMQRADPHSFDRFAVMILEAAAKAEERHRWLGKSL